MKKKIMHIVESFGGGVFSFLTELVNGTDDEFDIIIAYGIREETVADFKKYFSKKVRFIKIENFTRNINPQKDLKALKEIKNIIKKETPDIVHLHSSKAGVLGRLAVKGNKIKMFYNPHGFSFLNKNVSKIKRNIYFAIEKIIAFFNKNCIIIGCSEGEYREAKKLNKNCICINNSINTKELEKQIFKFKEKQIDYNNLKVCTIGRICDAKNPKMFNEIAESFLNIKFTWIGDGKLKNILKSPNIIVTGWKSREEVIKILNSQDIFILTSLWEGLPISLLEAMYMKKICIVSDCIGNRDVIKNKVNGFIFKDIEECKKVITDIINKKEYDINNIVHNTYESIFKQYNSPIMIKEYLKNYNSKGV